MEDSERLRPFVAGLVVDWLREEPDLRQRTVEGTLVFVDISGFTRLTERLATKGKIGAEEMSDILDVTFAALLGVAYDHGAWLVKWGGDAVLLLFEGDDNAQRACTAAHEMRRTMRSVGRLRTSAGAVTLRISIGVHTGAFDFFLVGSLHRELVITGSQAGRTVALESAADAGEIVVSPETAALLRPRLVGAAKGPGLLLARSPGAAPRLQLRSKQLKDIELGACLPGTTRDHLLAGGSDGEHRLVAVGFVEFSGIDTLHFRAGPGGVADAIDHLIRSCQEAAERHQVTFWETDVSSDGGKVMLVSGAPRSAGQDEDRMLAVVREVLDSGAALALRAGVSTGRVYAGEFGPPFRRTYSVKGDTVNTAARLMGRAGVGEIFATEAVLSRTRTAYETEQLEPLVVKGKARPVAAVRVGPARQADTAASATGTAFAGRDDELSALLDALARTREGNGEVWQVSGEAGIGKSRLVSELISRADAVTVLRVACDEYHSTTPYAPFRRLLRGLAGIGEAVDPVAAGVALREVVAQAVPSLLPWTPSVAAVLDARLPDTPETAAVDASFRKALQDEHAVRLLAGLIPGPLLLVAEDAHLMDDASTGLLRHLAAQAAERPWLVVTTQTTTGSPAALPLEGAQRLELAPLSLEAVAVVVKLATEDVPLPPHEMALLSSRAGGNPLFVLELLAASRGGSLSALPASVEGLMAVQIDRLRPRERVALRVASVLGSLIDRDVLDEVLRLEDIDQSAVQPLLGVFLEADGSALRFRHGLARDAAYEGLPFRRRQSLHGVAGEVIERQSAGRPEDVADLLSLHFLQARKFEAAWHYATVAGDRARAVHAQVAAADFYERALEAATRLGSPSHLEDAARARVWEALGDARYKLGEFGRAATAYRSAQRLWPHSVDQARLSYQCSLVADRSGRLASALRWLTRAEQVLAAAPGDDSDVLRLRSQCRAQRGLIRHWQGKDVAAAESLRQAVRLAEEARADDALATALVWLDNCEMTLGTSSGEHALHALALWQSIGDRPWEEARVLNQLGIRAYFAGRWNEAVDFYRESKLACERAGDQFTAAVESGNMAEVLSDQGHLVEAESLLREAQRVWRAAGAPSFVAFGKSQLGRLAARAGRHEEALGLLHSARQDYVRDGELGEVLETDARIAECLLLRGEPAAALAAVEEALATAPTDVPPQMPLLQRIKGVALAHTGNLEEALRALESSLVVSRERAADHETAWTLQALNAVRESAGLPADPTDVARQVELFAQLGIVTSAPLPA